MSVLVRVDVDIYRNCVEEENFKCEACNFASSSLKKVKEHFMIAHRNSYTLGCWKCEKKCTTILELRKHVGTNHYTPISESENQSLKLGPCALSGDCLQEWCCFR